MKKTIYVFLLALASLNVADADRMTPQMTFPVGQDEMHDIPGDAIKGLQPHIQIQKYDTDWNIEIDFLAQTNFSATFWLKTASPIGAQLQLWSADGAEIHSTNIDVVAATRLSTLTTVSNAMREVPWRRRGGQWLRNSPKGLSSGELAFSKAFSLKSVFHASFTNDVTLKIAPLLYKVDSNMANAELILFAPITVHLSTDGKVEKAK